MTALPATTLTGRLLAIAAERPDDVALREKDRGIWQEITWAEYAADVAAAGRALWDLGVRAGDCVAVLSDNQPEWLYADLGAQGIGARAAGIYQTNPPPDVAYVLTHAQVTVLFVQDQEQVDKAVQVADQTPTVQHVVIFDPRGTRRYDDPRLMRWDTLLARGRELMAAEPGWFADQVAQRDPAQASMIVYTSGTTGPPKGAMISPNNALQVAGSIAPSLGVTSDDVMLSYLPLCHVAEKIFTFFLPLTAGCTVHFGEDVSTVQADLREVSPTVFLGVPRIWEKMHASVTLKMRNSSWLKRWLFDGFTRRGQAIAERRRQGTSGLWDRVVWRLGDLLVFRALQERLGMRRCRLPVSGAAPISADLLAWFHGIGIPVLEGYGQTECAGVSHLNPPGTPRLGTVGRALPGVECRTDNDGEILLRGAGVFVGYLHDTDATARTVDAQGWLHTGDVGELDGDGFLRITGRKKEILITSGGKNLSPEKIENALKMSPYIKEAVAVGDARKFVSALVQIELDTVGDWADRRGLAYTSFEDLTGKDEVVALVDAEVRRNNNLLARVEQVREFRLLRKELHQDDGELTPTQKVRRREVLRIHGALVDGVDGIYGPGAP